MQDIKENVCFTVYPYTKEVTKNVFDHGKGDPDYSLERKVGQRTITIDKEEGIKVLKMGGKWVYTPDANTPAPPFGHLLNHCKKHNNAEVSRTIFYSDCSFRHEDVKWF